MLDVLNIDNGKEIRRRGNLLVMGIRLGWTSETMGRFGRSSSTMLTLSSCVLWNDCDMNGAG
jgi:hypothetical protein